VAKATTHKSSYYFRSVRLSCQNRATKFTFELKLESGMIHAGFFTNKLK
jgi:hypothetical protein